MTDHVASQCVENPVNDDFPQSRCSEMVIVIAMGTVTDHMAPLNEVFTAGFKMRVAKCDFIKTEIEFRDRGFHSMCETRPRGIREGA